MSGQLIRYPKGSIWWLDSECLPIGTSIEKKNRPVVIVSSDERGSSTVVEVCTITSKDKSGICQGINVPFRNSYGTLNYIQTNQHFTVDVNYLREFQGMLSRSTLDRLNSSLRFAQDLGNLDDLSTQVHCMEKTISSLKRLECDRKSLDVSMAYLKTVVKDIEKHIVTLNMKLSESKIVSDKKKLEKQPRRYIRFDEETMLKYLIDIESVDNGDISQEAFLKNWGISDMKSARKKVTYINNKLNKE